MCDYSLHAVASRPARAGDKLVSTTFRNSITRGFAAVGEPAVAVCLLPGTELAFETNVKYDNFLAILPKRTVKERTARFRKVNEEDHYTHHDALEFPSGKIVLLTQLCSGQIGTVLQLPATRTSSVEDNVKRVNPVTREMPSEPTLPTLPTWLSGRS
jgi:hypothetical protein